MSIFYLFADRAVGDRRLPPVAFPAVAFHRFDETMSAQLSQLVEEMGDPSIEGRRHAAAAWRFRRKKKRSASS